MSGKNVVLCLDGTGNQVKGTGNTNVLRLYAMLDHSDPERQVTYYDPGLGTFSAQGAWTPWARWFTRTAGLAFGMGLRANVEEAYTFLINNWEPGDRIFIFGFSRGAYTGRVLASMLHGLGILRPGCEHLVPYASAVFLDVQTRIEDGMPRVLQHGKQRALFTHAFAVGGKNWVPVDFLGIWDTVNAIGFLKRVNYPFTRTLPNVQTARHAVSIDERRRLYREVLFDPYQTPDVDVDKDLREAWFAGVHSDVGGAFDDDPRLGQIAFKWILHAASDSGLLLNLEGRATLRVPLTRSHALGQVHRMHWIWSLLTYRRRVVPEGATLHRSVWDRMQEDPTFSPNLPRDVAWEDLQWAS